MRHLVLSIILFLTSFILVLTNASCSKDDGSETQIPESASVYVGTWVCYSSIDVSETTGKAVYNQMKGQIITINSNCTYTSTSSNFGNSGTFEFIGNQQLSVKTDVGQNLILKIEYKLGVMTWEGSANGYKYHYEFRKQS